MAETQIQQRAGHSQPQSELLFSIIIPVRNEEQHLARCLASLQQMQFPREQFEVIVVDNGSTDHTVDVARKFEECFSLQILERPGVYISAVRNTGAWIARGRYLAFLDSDCEVRPDWLGHASLAASRASARVFGSFYLIPEGSSWVARHWQDERERKQSGEVPYLPAGDLFVDRELFFRVGGFDETIQTNEDYEFCQRIRSAGITVTSLPELGVIHWGTAQSITGFFRKNRWHGMHVFRVFLRNLPALYNIKPVALAIYTLLCLGCILTGALAAARWGTFSLLAGGLVALIIPPSLLGLRAAISARRLWSVLPMAFLFLIYAIARASCLVDWRNWRGSAVPASQHRTGLAAE